MDAFVGGCQSEFLRQPGTTVGCTAPPDNIQDWISFVTTLINHHNGVTAPHVKYYEIWNEANSSAFWTGSVASRFRRRFSRTRGDLN
jgi:hypothetical protein